MTDLSAEDFEAIIAAMLERIERMERENLQIDKAARQTETRFLAEIARLNARLVACEVPIIRAYYTEPTR